MTQEDKVFEQLADLSNIRMDPARKLSIRDELQQHMSSERPKRFRWPRLRGLVPGAVAAAAVVIAGIGIAGIVTHTEKGHFVPERVHHLIRTTGAGAAGGEVMAGSSNLWFYITMGILVGCALLVFLTRKWNSPWQWSAQTMTVLRSPVIWGAAFGIVVGIRGIPVIVPYSASNWVWEMPSNYYVASTTGFAALGCLIGAMIQFGVHKKVSWHLAWWAFGMPALALLVGLIGFYRTQASTRDSLWTTARLALMWDYTVAENLSKNPSQDQVRILGTELIMAGADLGSLSSHSALLGSGAHFEEVGNALNLAGTILVQSNNPQQMRTAEKFVNQSYTPIRKAIVATHDNLTGQDMTKLVNEILNYIPQHPYSWDYQNPSN